MILNRVLPDSPSTPALEAVGICKRFGGVQALMDVNLTVRIGEIHGLVGENGSGKSTLVKVLAGYHSPDAGSLAVFDTKVPFPLEPGAFHRLGLAFVHQDLGLVPSLTVLENLLLARMSAARGEWRVAWRRERKRVAEILSRFEVSVNLDSIVGELRPVDRSLIAIVRALDELGSLSQKNGVRQHVLVLDEPTVFLPRSETNRLFSMLSRIREQGASVIFVAHNLEEILTVTDTVTVLRNGRVVGAVDTRDVTRADLIHLIVGADSTPPHNETSPANVGSNAFRISGLNGGLARNLNFEISPGEIVGITGLIGSGFEEVPYLLFAATRASMGTLMRNGKVLDLSKMTPQRAMDAGIALVPGDRRGQGCVLTLPATENVLMNAYNRFFRRGVLRGHQMEQAAGELFSKYDVRPPTPAMAYGLFSGGNQQKGILAKWLYLRPQLLLAHEPTQGVDVGARAQIFAFLRQAAREQGMAVLCATIDYEQLAVLCNRVLVMRDGVMAEELNGSALTEANIIRSCLAAA